MNVSDLDETRAPADGEHPGGRFVVQGAPPRADVRLYGEGLARVLDLVAERMPRGDIERAWAFPGVRREGREYGVAVIERRGGEGRRVVYRARWIIELKGQERGKTIVELEETAVAPAELLPRVLDGVRQRADEAGEAEPVNLGPWKAADGGEPLID